ncbi:MAG: PaaI family thioesterase [Clostridiales Family XIII bacterium]|jgi:acyl-CoA thioesterase|nr:PaaI family thioesterase [Clostridiales Family XIII bacterium]
MADTIYDIEKIRGFFTGDRYLMLTGIRIDAVGEDAAALSFDIADMHYNAGGVVQGGAIYTLADSAFAVASNAAHIARGEKKITVSQSASISYLRPARGARLIANASKISGGNRISVYSIEVTDELGTKVAHMTGNAYTVELKERT